MASFFEKLGFGSKSTSSPTPSPIAQSPDTDAPSPNTQFAQFGAGCFWGVELAFQRVPGVTKTEVGYSQGVVDKPSYEDVCTGKTGHVEVVRVEFDGNECGYGDLLGLFWGRHDPTTVNRQEKARYLLQATNNTIMRRVFVQFIWSESPIIEVGTEVSSNMMGNDVGTQYRSGIYYYTPEQEQAARESLEQHQKLLNANIVTEILPAKKFYRAEEYHQQYLEKGGRSGFKQSAAKRCNDPIRCYG
ncbi:Peptide methionine sulfoxide reductase A3-like protein [Drosera capensis]